MDGLTTEIIETAGAGGKALSELDAICATGGRFAGSESEIAAREYLARRLKELTGAEPFRMPIEDMGWVREDAWIELLGANGGVLPCESLVRSPSTPSGGLIADVIDLGRGTEADFRTMGAEIPGNIVMVRHEYMFATDTIHRRKKYQWAMERGAVGFLIACPLPGDLPVTGSSGATPVYGIPAAGISAETAKALSAGGRRRIRLTVAAGNMPRRTENLILDIPGRTDEWVALSAHIDGHHLSESAMDNGTGLAAVLAITGALAPHADAFERGLRICFFTIEEWALAGSAAYLDAMSEAERAKIMLNVNLDTIAGSPNLTALTSGYAKAERWFVDCAAQQGRRLGAFRPTMANSDHYNFARHGIPAARFVCGFDEPYSELRYLLTPMDNRDRIDAGDLAAATKLVAGIVAEACRAPELLLR